MLFGARLLLVALRGPQYNVERCRLLPVCSRRKEEFLPFHQLPRAKLMLKAVRGSASSCLSALDFHTSHNATWTIVKTTFTH